MRFSVVLVAESNDGSVTRPTTPVDDLVALPSASAWLRSFTPPLRIPFHSNHLFQASATARLLARSGDLKEYFQHGRALLPTASILCLLMNHSHTDKKSSGWLTLTVSGPFQELLNLSYM